jgi:hypothetical protein
MEKVSVRAGKAPCRHCGERAATAPVQRMAKTRAFEPRAEGDEAEAGTGAPAPGFGHDFAGVAVSRPGEGEDDG